MDLATALWVLLPLAGVHLALARRRPALVFQLLVDAALLALPLRPLATGLHLGPGMAPSASMLRAETTVGGPAEQTDLPLQFSVWWEEVRRLAAAGEPPWISDRLGGGTPLFAHAQTGIPFPLHAPVWALGAERGTDVMAVWKLELAALGGFFLLRRLGVRAAAGALGALAYAFGLYMLSWLVVPLSWVVAAAPWAMRWLLGALRGRRTDAARLALLLGALAGGSVHPESAAFLWLAVAAAGATLGWGRRRRLARLAAPLLLAIAVAGVGALPTLAAIADSAKLAEARTEPRYPAPGLDAGLRVRVAALLVAPWREGHPARHTWRWSFPAVAVSVGVGAAPLVLLLAGGIRRRQRRAALALAVVGGGAAILLWQVPGAADLLARLPVLGWMVWARAAFLVSFSLAFLAALGADAWLRRPRPLRLAAAALAVEAVAVALVLTSPVQDREPADTWTAAMPLALAAAAPLAAAAGGWLLPGAVLLESTLWGADVLPRFAAPAPPEPLVARLRQLAAERGGRVIGLAWSIHPNLAAGAGLADLRSNEPMRSRSLAALHQALGCDGLDLPGPITRPWAGLAGAWGVRWLVAPPPGLAAHPAAAAWTEVYRDADGCVYENSRALPVLRLATAAVAPPGDARQGGWERVDFATAAVVADPPHLNGHGETTVLEQRPWRHSARVVADGDVLAVLHVPRTTGWHAELDGRSAPMLTADLAAMAVVVPAGAHLVRFVYRPAWLAAGAALTLAGVAGCAVLARRRRAA